MKPLRRTLVITMMAAAAAQMPGQTSPPRLQEELRKAEEALQKTREQMREVEKLDLKKLPDMLNQVKEMRLKDTLAEIESKNWFEHSRDIEQKFELSKRAFEYMHEGNRFSDLSQALEALKPVRAWSSEMEAKFPHFDLPLFAWQGRDPQSEALRQQREQAEREREARDRAREQAERARNLAARSIDDYQNGLRTIERREYERAIEYFDRVIDRKGDRVDGALYWKAYSLNKMGKRPEALAVIAELEKIQPPSRWLNDARALALEVKGGGSPESQADEDLKLLAINSIIHQDAERGVPLLEKLLNDPKVQLNIKKQALFVLAQNHQRAPKARDIVAQYAKSGSNPDLQLSAISYLGNFRSTESLQALSEVYASTSDAGIKRSILRGYANSRAKDRLLQLAKSEQNSDLRHYAIQQLGNMQAQAELTELYNNESTFELKEAILYALSNSQATDKLIEIAKGEKDSRLRRTAIRQLGNSRRERTADALSTLYGSESDKVLKLDIIHALANQNSAKHLVDIARKESDPALKLEIVNRLRNSRAKEAIEYMIELVSK